MIRTAPFVRITVLGAVALTVLLVVLVALAAPAVAQTIKVDAKLTNYQRTSGVSGDLNSIGSDTLNNLMTFWAESFRKVYPNVNIQIEGKGSSTAPPALIEGTAQLGPMSRQMKSEEVEAFQKKFGYKPTPIVVAIDTLAVFVNKDNPVNALSLLELDAIFSKNRKGGFSRNVTTWGQVGVKGALRGTPISLYGRNSASGTYGYFKDHALFKGDFKDRVKEQPGSASVVQGVASDKGAIGYSGIGYATSGVKAIALAEKLGGKAYEPTYANAINGSYPLARALYVYVNRHPTRGLDKLTTEILKLVLSKEGQEIAVKDGYLPLPADLAGAELAKLK